MKYFVPPSVHTGHRYTLDINEILERMRLVLDAKNDAALARALGVEPNTIATWKRRETVPWELCVRLHEEHGTDLNWLLYDQPSLEHGFFCPPTVMFCPPRDQGGLSRLESDAWTSGMNVALHIGGPDRPFMTVAAKEDDMVKRRPMITVPMTDDAMDPTLKYYDTATAALILPEANETWEYAQLHGRLVVVVAGTWSTGGELVIRRLIKVPKGFDLVADNQKHPVHPFLRHGKLTEHWRLAGEVMVVMNLVGRGLGKTW